MANAARAEEQTAPPGEAHEKDAPLLDLSDAAVKRLMKTAKARGFVTLDQLNSVLPSQEFSPDQIEDILSMMSDMGITVVESEEAEESTAEKDAPDDADDEDGSRSLVAPSLPATTTTRSEPTDRTDDPVRMYLRDMGSVELLSREGEIAIAKRIEAGREAMIAGLCESPLTFQAIIIWRDELNIAKILLRDVIDLEATYEGPEAKAAPPPPVAAPAGPAQVAAPAPAAAAGGEEAEGEEGAPRAEGELDEEDDFENAMSLAAMEASSSPRCSRPSTRSPTPTIGCASCRTGASRCTWRARGVRAAADAPTRTAREVMRGRAERVAQRQPRRDAGGAAVRRQPQAGQLEGRLQRMAVDCGITREQFIESTTGHELDQDWLDRVARLPPTATAGRLRLDGAPGRRGRIRAPTSARSPRRPGSRSASSGASSRRSGRASARRARPRRRWSRPTYAS